MRSITAVARRIAPDLVLTVGWAKTESAAIMADQFDLVSYHDYAPVEGARERLAAVQVQVGDKPVVITEIGTSSYNGVFGFPGSERGQAKMLEARLAAATKRFWSHTQG
ncbi:MAG: hypothetical protein EP336_17955 [Rhodobacteraceae bacterium]|nr:MAG: hypothetical protein EP336_17955 [Paracoccaceae bacterium]